MDAAVRGAKMRTTIMNNIYKIEGEMKSNIRTFVGENALEGNNKKFVKLYNNIAPFYNLSQKLFYQLKFGGEEAFRYEFLKYINVRDMDFVLETSVGTADNFCYMNKKANYYGVDISYGMLKQALKHVRKWNVNAEFICCEAENLPFNDGVFDVVYSCGGINFYNDKQKAVNEMIRVAKHGTKIFIIDETEKTVKEIYKTVPGKNLYNVEQAKVPLELIPKEMKNINYM